MIKNINMYQLMEIIKDRDLLIIDVRDANEYAQKRIYGAINITYDNIDIISKKYPDRNKKILVYCTKGARSIVVAEQLDRLGYKKIYNLEKGIEKNLNST